MGLEVTPFYVGLSLIFAWYLSFRVIRLRRSFKVGIGTGSQPELARAVRVHGNFIEQVPLTLVGLALLELQALPFYIVHALGLTLMIGRLLHAQGLSSTAGISKGRFLGMALTFMVQFIIALALILNFIHLIILEVRS